MNAVRFLLLVCFAGIYGCSATIPALKYPENFSDGVPLEPIASQYHAAQVMAQPVVRFKK